VNKFLPLAIYRSIDAKHSPEPYVLTSPHKKTILYSLDKIFVLSQALPDGKKPLKQLVSSNELQNQLSMLRKSQSNHK